MYCHDFHDDGSDHYDHGDYDDFDMIIIMVNRGARKLWIIG